MAGLPKGRTNNPNGRPPKNRSLSTILEISMGKTFDYGGRRVAGKRILAEMVTKAVVTGRLRFPEDTEDSVVSLKDWIGLVQWVYERIDGKPTQPFSNKGEPINIVGVNYRTTIADLAPRSMGDSEASGEGEDPFDGSEMG